MCAPSPPAAPDPRAVAGAQAEFNEKAARTTAALNRYDTVTPYGTQRWRNVGGGPSYDYDAYNKALQDYSGSLGQGGGAWNPDPDPFAVGEQPVWMPSGAQAGPAPSLEAYRIPGVSDKWETEIALSPEGQQLFNQQNRIATNLMRVAGDQLGRVESNINQPLDLSALPGRVSSVSPTTGYAGGIAPAGEITRGYDPVSFGTTFGDAGQVQRGFADVGGAQRSVGANDFSVDRRRVEDAIFSRLNDQIERDREAMRANSIVRGLNPTTEAYTREADQFNRQANDARMQAVLAGGQEQSRLFGLDLAKGQFANQAQAQDYAQALGRGSFSNQAQQQAYAQALGRGQFANDAASRELAQRQNLAAFGNAAQAQQFGQNAQMAQFQNQERQQQLQEALANANLSNSQRQAALQELLAMRLNPLNELNALRTGNQVTVPQFTPSPSVGVAAPNYMGAAENAYQSQVANANAEAAANAQMLGGLFGIGLGVAGLPTAGGASLGGAALSKLFGI